ncbi:MAG: alkaline phosphatase family protein [Deltaproteobacteria bacterium]|nr:alkaline phosphatase family protein [Deltaproteobacteria bacterium]
MSFPELIIIGLDSFSPLLAFDKLKEQMPFLNSMCKKGMCAPMRSTDPPITSPAWISMTSGKRPEELGIYGFNVENKNSRLPHIVNSNSVNTKRIWDYAADINKKSVVVSVPVTYPPVENPNITMVSGFLTPSIDCDYVNPKDLKGELNVLFGDYIIDVDNFRSENKDQILSDLRAYTSQHFDIFRYLIEKESPHFAMITDLGPDRFHHSMLSSIHPNHKSYKLKKEALQYYSLLDEEIKKTCDLAGPDTLVMVVSDHGVKPLLGAVGANEILIEEGLLVLNDSYPQNATPLSQLNINWSKSAAFARGGYAGRIFLNLKSRFSDGSVSKKRAPVILDKIRQLFNESLDNNGVTFKNELFTPQELYTSKYLGIPPDLTIYFGNLDYRCAGTVGHGTHFLETNDNGPDDANHDFEGIFVIGNTGVIDAKDILSKKLLHITDIFKLAQKKLGF